MSRLKSLGEWLVSVRVHLTTVVDFTMSKIMSDTLTKRNAAALPPGHPIVLGAAGFWFSVCGSADAEHQPINSTDAAAAAAGVKHQHPGKCPTCCSTPSLEAAKRTCS
jgi:hypothetical protein